MRLECVRYLDLDPETSLPAGETAKSLVTECHSLVVEFLLSFSQGKVLPGEVNKKGEPIGVRQKPYGKDAGMETRAFKNVSPTCFAISLATLYPFLTDDIKNWPERLKSSVMYPCTSLWPVKVVKRYSHFINVVCKQLQCAFGNYEAAGGDYHLGEDSEDEGGTEEDGEEKSQTSEDCDDVF